MQTLQLKPKDQGGIIDQMLRLKASINYHNAEILPKYKDMGVWEVNEYEVTNNANVAELERLERYIIKHESLFNELLFEYGYTVTTFLAKFINSVNVKYIGFSLNSEYFDLAEKRIESIK